MDITVLGCGEAFDETLPNTSLLLRSGDRTMLLDCGYSAPPRVWAAGATKDEIDLIYVSHAHADHYFGLAPLLGRMWEEGRTKPLIILSQPSVIAQIKDLLEYGYRTLPGRFKFSIDYLSAAPGECVQLCGASFEFAETRHSVTNLAVRIAVEQKLVCYSGDGMFTDASQRLFEGADLVFHEAFWFEESVVHADIGRLLAMGVQAGVREMALVHVQRDLRRSPARIEAAVAAVSGLNVAVPAPGRLYNV